MARGTQLSVLVSRLKAETRQSASVALGVDRTAEFKEILRRTQENLYDDYDWPHLRVFQTVSLVAGSRYYDFPTSPTLNLERIEQVAVTYNGSPHPVERGIGFEQYNQYEPEDDERSDPVLRWDVRWNESVSRSQIEVWPLPASAMTLRLQGIRALGALTSNSDTADLDDRLIVLFAAAEVLASKKAEDAAAKLSAANTLYSKLKGRIKGGSSMTQYGGGDAARNKPHGTVIRIA